MEGQIITETSKVVGSAVANHVLWSLLIKDFMHRDCSMMLTRTPEVSYFSMFKVSADLVSQSP